MPQETIFEELVSPESKRQKENLSKGLYKRPKPFKRNFEGN